jgi:hypothetical protein
MNRAPDHLSGSFICHGTKEAGDRGAWRDAEVSVQDDGGISVGDRAGAEDPEGRYRITQSLRLSIAGQSDSHQKRRHAR